MEDLIFYYPTTSFWHQLDPRSKLIIIIILMIISLIVNGSLLFLLGWLVFLLFLSARIPFHIWFSSLIRFKWLLIFTFIINLLLNFQYPITIYHALVITFRLGLVLTFALWLNLTTPPAVLIDGLTKLSKPCSVFNKRGWDVVLIMNLVLRFIPELIAESDQISMIQKIRGVTNNKSWLSKQTYVKSYLVPLFVLCFRKSAMLAVAMHTRGYRLGEPRSTMIELKIKAVDYFIISSSGLLLIFFIYFNFRGLL